MSVPANIVNQQGQGVVPADQLNTFVLGGSLLANLQGFTGVSNMMVALLGFTQPNDGGQGLFYYVSSGSYTADNVNVVVPNGATQGAWIRVQIGTSGSSLVETVFPNLSSAEGASLTSSTKAITILGYAALGDAPPRTMVSIAAPATPEPWYVHTADGGYWQDSGGDFWVEWLGAIAAAGDCSTALNNAFLAHLHLGMVLRGKGDKNCTNQVYWNPNGFQTRFCWAEFNGAGNANTPGMSIIFSAGVAAPCFGMYDSTTIGGLFYGKLKGLLISGDTDGLMAQIGRSDVGDPSNDFAIHVTVSNSSSGSLAAVLQVNGLYTSADVYLEANGPNAVQPSGSLATLYALQLNSCNSNTIKVAVGGMNIGLQLTSVNNICATNEFSGEIALCYIGYSPNDDGCLYNSVRNMTMSSNTYPIDNHLTFVNSFPSGAAVGAPVTFDNCNISTAPHLFFNPAATDATWGGVGVTLHNAQLLSTPDFTPPSGSVPASGTWVLNKSGVAQFVSFFGDSTGHAVDIYVGAWDYFYTSSYVAVSDSVPYGVVIGAGEIINLTFNAGTYTWAWRPLVTL